jgi:hypothetical protein
VASMLNGRQASHAASFPEIARKKSTCIWVCGALKCMKQLAIQQDAADFLT